MVRWTGVFASVFAALFLCGCGGGSGSSNLPKPVVQFINASPDSVALDLLVDDDTVAAAIAHLGFSPAFVEVEAGDLDLTLQEAGTTLGLVAEVRDFARDKSYVVVAVGLELFGAENLKRLRIVLIDVDRTVPTGNKSRLLVVHGYNRKVGSDTPDIDFQTPGDNPLFKIPGMTFGSQSSILIDSGAQSFEIRRSGTTSVIMTGSFTLDAGKIYACVVTGIEDELAPMDPQILLVPIATRP